MPQNTHVRVRQDDGREWDCPTRYLPHAREHGWVPINEDTDTSLSSYADPIDGDINADDGD